MTHVRYIKESKVKNVADNPVTKAVAKYNLSKMLRDHRIYLYLMPNGDNSDRTLDLLEAINTVLAVIGLASEMSKIDPEDKRLKVLRGGLSASQQCLLQNRWIASNAVAIDTALSAAESLNNDLKAEFIKAAWYILVGDVAL